MKNDQALAEGGASSAGRPSEGVTPEANAGASGTDETAAEAGSGGGESPTKAGGGGQGGEPPTKAGGGGQGGEAQAGAGSSGTGSASSGTPVISVPSGGAANLDPIDPSIQEVAKPGCLADNPILSSAHALTANAVPNNVFYTLYATDPQSNMVLLRYPQTPSDDAPYWPWGCFDSNLRPEQISAINIYDQPSPYNTPEVYATNAGGRLFVRRYFKTAWTQWEVMGLPRASSHLSDVAASSTPQTLPFVYVLDGGRLFTRRHASAQAYSDYTPWREIGGVPADAVRLCAGVGSDQRQQLFVLTQNGNVFDALQANGDPDAAFGEFQPSVQASSHAMADIDCGYLADGTLTVFGLSSGVVWFHSSGAPDSLDWTTEPSAAPSSFNVFAIGSRPNLAPSIFGIDSTNAVWAHLLGSSSWTPLY